MSNIKLLVIALIGIISYVDEINAQTCTVPSNDDQCLPHGVVLSCPAGQVLQIFSSTIFAVESTITVCPAGSVPACPLLSIFPSISTQCNNKASCNSGPLPIAPAVANCTALGYTGSQFVETKYQCLTVPTPTSANISFCGGSFTGTVVEVYTPATATNASSACYCTLTVPVLTTVTVGLLSINPSSATPNCSASTAYVTDSEQMQSFCVTGQTFQYTCGPAGVYNLNYSTSAGVTPNFVLEVSATAPITVNCIDPNAPTTVAPVTCPTLFAPLTLPPAAPNTTAGGSCTYPITNVQCSSPGFNITCPASLGTIEIFDSGVYMSKSGACPAGAGGSCPVAVYYINATTVCDGHSSCVSGVVATQPIPAACTNTGYIGGQFLQTKYLCLPPPATISFCGGTYTSSVIDINQIGLNAGSTCACSILVPAGSSVTVALQSFNTTGDTCANTAVKVMTGTGTSSLCVVGQTVYTACAPAATIYNVTFGSNSTVTADVQVQVIASGPVTAICQGTLGSVGTGSTTIPTCPTLPPPTTPPPLNCSVGTPYNNVTCFTTQTAVATFGCPAGQLIVVHGVTFFHALTASCSNLLISGSSCFFPSASYVQPLVQLCNSQQSCTYPNITVPANDPTLCIGYTGAYGFDVNYGCVPELCACSNPVTNTNTTCFFTQTAVAAFACPSGLVMNITDVLFLHATVNSCDPNAISGASCFFDTTQVTPAIMSQCNGQNNCTFANITVPSTDPQMCGGYTGPFVFQVSYGCVPAFCQCLLPTPEVGTSCSLTSSFTASFSCPNGGQMTVTSVDFFQATVGTCSAPISGASCFFTSTAATIEPLIAAQCQNLSSCSYPVSAPSDFSTTCSGYSGPFIFEAQFTCIPASCTNATVNCTSVPMVNNYCTETQVGQATLTCPLRYGMVIRSATLFRSITGNCLSAAGSSCVVDMTANAAAMTTKCFGQNNCLFNLQFPTKFPSSCGGFFGPFTLTTNYDCFVAPVSPNISALCVAPPCTNAAPVVNIDCFTTTSSMTTNLNCSAGQGMIIVSSTLFRSITGTCAVPAGSSCTIDATNIYAAISAKCNTMNACPYNFTVPSPLPSTCNGYTGPYVLDTVYKCFPQPVSPTQPLTCPCPVPTPASFPFCFTGASGTATFSCPAGQAMIISSTGLFQNIVGTCAAPGGSSCTIDMTTNFANMSKVCNAMGTCTYTVNVPASLPASCSGFIGPFFLNTNYNCYPAPVNPAVVATCVPPNPCSKTSMLDPICLGTATTQAISFSCPSGQGMIITSASLFKSITGSCASSGGSSCTIDTTNIYSALVSKCNTMTSCSYTVTVPIPNSCTAGFTGPYFVQVAYDCYQSPVSPNVASVCGTNATSPPVNTTVATTNCNAMPMVSLGCAPTVSFSCPAGSYMILTKSLESRYSSGCSTSPTCPPTDTTVNYGNLVSQCNLKQTCTYNMTIITSSACSTFPYTQGAYFLQTYFTCYQGTPNPNIQSICNTTTTAAPTTAAPTCNASPVINLLCLAGTTSNITCPAGFSVVIKSSGIYQSITGVCGSFSGSSCFIQPVPAIYTQCNFQQTCTFTQALPTTNPCSSANSGPIFLQTIFYCYPASIAMSCASNSTTVAPTMATTATTKAAATTTATTTKATTTVATTKATTTVATTKATTAAPTTVKATTKAPKVCKSNSLLTRICLFFCKIKIPTGQNPFPCTLCCPQAG